MARSRVVMTSPQQNHVQTEARQAVEGGMQVPQVSVLRPLQQGSQEPAVLTSITSLRGPRFDRLKQFSTNHKSLTQKKR